MAVILKNHTYTIFFYFFVFLPLYSLIFVQVFKRFKKNISGIDAPFLHCVFYAYTSWFILSSFSASLAFLLLSINAFSYYFFIHFFLVIPIVSFCFSAIFFFLTEKKYTKNLFPDLIIFLSSFSLFLSLTYMALKFW